MSVRNLVLIVSASLAGIPAAAAADPPLTRATPRELIAVLNEEGFRGGQVVEEKGEEFVRIKVEGHPVVFILTRNGGDLLASTGFTESKATLQRVNAWNKSKRYSRAYLADDGTAFLRLDLDLSKGVTRATLGDYMTTFLKLVGPFRKEVCE